MSKNQAKESLDSLLSNIADSIDSTSSVVDSLNEIFNTANVPVYPDLIEKLLKSTDSNNSLDSVSLLSLKNSALLGYVTDLTLLLALRLKSMKDKDSNTNENHELILKSTVTDRVILEKGVKSLEKKMSYQLEKMVNAYHRREKEQEDIEKKQLKKTDNEDVEEEEDEDEEEEEEGLNFRPNPRALLQGKTSESKKPIDKTDDTEADENSSNTNKEKYRPPKIAATSLNDPDKEIKTKKQRNLQSMDEYLQDIGDAPSLEKSIGSTIINKGRDVKSKKQMEKEAEIQRYEEENFIRLPSTKTKENKNDRAKRLRNEFFGEDWSMFENNRDLNDNGNAPKKRKRINAWERAKRKIDK